MMRLSAVAAFGLALATPLLAAPALAQSAKPAETITLVEGSASAPVTVLGAVSAEHHQKSMFSKTDAREELNKQLRTAAAKLGADAVVDIKYEMNSPMMSKKGQLAKGTAVKYVNAPVQQAVVSPPVQVAAAPPPPVVVAPVAPVVPAPVIPAPVATPPNIAIPVPTPPPPAAAPAAPVAAAGVIMLAEGDLPGGRAYGVVGAVTVEAKPQLDKAPKQVLDEALRAKAKAMGADAVIQIRYDATGASAQGVAVKLK